jgi:centromere/kinetochore protein ZW10
LVQKADNASWGLDEGGSNEETEENGWGFDDDDEPEPEVELESATEQENDPADAWGWNDEETSPVDDDPWAEELNEPTRPPAVPSIPNPATDLGKLSAKGKAPQTNGTSPTKPTDQPQSTVRVPPQETYLVSGRTKNIIRLVEGALREGQEVASSQLFSSSSSSSSPPGTLILHSAVSIIDLYRALYPVTFGSHFALSPELALRFSNDCLYLSGEAGKIECAVPSDSMLKQKLGVSQENLKILGDSWFEDCIVSVSGYSRSPGSDGS